MAMSEQTNVLRNDFVKYLLRHVSSYTEILQIKLVPITERKYQRIYLHHTNYNMSNKAVSNSI